MFQEVVIMIIMYLLKRNYSQNGQTKFQCKKAKDTCSENEECCTKSCHDTFKNKICLVS